MLVWFVVDCCQISLKFEIFGTIFLDFIIEVNSSNACFVFDFL